MLPTREEYLESEKAKKIRTKEDDKRYRNKYSFMEFNSAKNFLFGESSPDNMGITEFLTMANSVSTTKYSVEYFRALVNRMAEGNEEALERNRDAFCRSGNGELSVLWLIMAQAVDDYIIGLKRGYK